MNRLQITALAEFPLVQHGADLAALTISSLERAEITLQHGDILVIASKIVSKAEGRARHLNDILPSPAAREIAKTCAKDPRLVELILAESSRVLRLRPGLIVVEHRNGFICANAGIDHSNTNDDDDVVLLLPEDPDHSARTIRQRLLTVSGADVAIVINDSHGRAWRMGTVGVAIGIAGLLPLTDRRGAPDLFGRPLQVTELGTADEIAAAGSLLQGGAGEGLPVVHMRGVPFVQGPGHLRDILRPHELDMFR